ncbi:hypothetical protein RH858_04065 [Halalkaliarchaeum sp. AArc-GB]|uniref:hypothetical protein n=1 Tax=Halalkaliarchaeum sp. AArc-GB TaxID=3074078 RepID=UPI002862EC3A|nr:hypothetical protein [Halalkaliarchaeum sp. AArc-GB]MDR5672327.1 hypothetical protein [Halalkaliarchaeum sp. AArc-GB]
MTVFLIQVNGAEQSKAAPPGHSKAGGKGPRYCDDPFKHHQYVNGGDYWKQEAFGRRDAWEAAAPGDVVFLYATSDVHEEWGASLSHVLRIEEKQIDEVGARLDFDRVIELDQKIPYAEIHDRVDSGEFSERMAYCGQEGFNITHVTAGDLETVLELTELE